MLREETARHARPRQPQPNRAAATCAPRANDDARMPTWLQAALRAWRSEIARQRNVPAYVVLHDATIDGIAAARAAHAGRSSAKSPASATRSWSITATNCSRSMLANTET